MAKRQYLPLLVSSYNKLSARGSVAQRLVNMFLEEVPVLGTGTKWIAYSCPGIETWLTLPTSTVRGMFVHKDILYVAAGTAVYSITASGTVSTLGTIDAAASIPAARVHIAAINDDIVFCNGVKAWNYRVSTGAFSQITDVDLPFNTILKVLSFGEYILFLISSSQTVYVSVLSDATSVTALSYFAAESFYDDIISGIVAQNYIYLFGSVTTEIWYNSGGQTVPFDKTAQGGISYGCAAPNSVAVINNEVYFLAKDINGLIGLMKYSGTQPSILLNRSLNEKLASYVSIDDCFAWVDVHNGHQFLNLTFPSATVTNSVTHTYDITTDKWLEREIWNQSGVVIPDYEGHHAYCSAYFNNKQYIGDRRSGIIYEISMDITDDAGYEMVREIITPHVIADDLFISMSDIEVDVERGIAVSSGQGSDPTLTLWVSRDRGATWDGGFDRSCGALGTYRTQVKWASMGGGQSITLKLTMSDPVKWVIHGITAEIEGEVNIPLSSGVGSR